MEQYDPKTAQRVWQRVRGEQPEAASGELQLLAMEAETAAILGALTQNRRGNPSPLREVLQQCRRHMACLRGICQLRQGSRPAIPEWKETVSNREASLRRCYVNTLNLANQYEARKDDPEYGCVFADLAAAKRRHCGAFLELLGSGKPDHRGQSKS